MNSISQDWDAVKIGSKTKTPKVTKGSTDINGKQHIRTCSSSDSYMSYSGTYSL